MGGDGGAGDDGFEHLGVDQHTGGRQVVGVLLEGRHGGRHVLFGQSYVGALLVVHQKAVPHDWFLSRIDGDGALLFARALIAGMTIRGRADRHGRARRHRR